MIFLRCCNVSNVSVNYIFGMIYERTVQKLNQCAAQFVFAIKFQNMILLSFFPFAVKVVNICLDFSDTYCLVVLDVLFAMFLDH